jgi:integrase
MEGKLTATAVKNAKPGPKPYKLADGAGMYLLVSEKNGQCRKWWRFDYRLNEKRFTLSLGVYDDVSLKTARERRTEARALVASGVNPSAVRKHEKGARNGLDTFKTVAEEWLAKFRPLWAEKHTEKVEGRLKNYVYPWLGNQAVNSITSADLLRVLRRVESKGACETAHRIRQHCGRVFRYAIATGRADNDITHGLRGALAPAKVKHRASVTEPKAIGDLLRAIDSYSGHLVTRTALKLAPLVFVRPGELRKAEWEEIDFEKAEWRISAEKMKMGRPHIVPLSKQAVEALLDIHPLTGKGRYVFPSARTKTRPMSDAAITNALRNMGYSGEEMSGHGFRSMASTRLNEMGWNRDAIERQLAHVEGNAVRAAYNYAEHLPERVRMMQAWADYLDGLREGAEIVAIQRPAKSAT